MRCWTSTFCYPTRVPPSSLSQRLTHAISPDFFRPLTRASAAVYVDVANRLVEEAGLAGRLPLQEAQQILREVMAAYPQERLEDDEGAQLRDIRQRASVFMNRLLAAGWVEEQTLGLQDRRIVISPALRLLLGMLRALAEEEIAELQTFADTLRGVCDTLENPHAMDPQMQTGEGLRGVVNDLNQRLDLAIQQLYSVEKLIAGFEARQRQSESPAETLRLFYTEFAQGQHMVCYDVLSRGGLLSRLRAARVKVSERLDDPFTRQRLAEGLQMHYKYDEAECAERARRELTRLERSLGGLGEIARAVDERMAAFNRLSQQRYRYQTEVRGRRPELVKAYCDAINEAHTSGHFRDLANEGPDFAPLCPELQFYHGTTSLWKSHHRRSPADLRFSAGRATLQDEAAALEAMKARQRLALTPHRAAKLVAKILPESKTETQTDGFSVNNTDELLDLLAVAAYDHAHDENGRMIRWKVSTDRSEKGLRPDELKRDKQLEWLVDRFQIKRTT